MELNLQLAPNQPIPSTLSQVDFLFDGLYSNSLMVVDLPFEVSTTTDRGAGGWLEIATGLKTKITEAEVQDGTLFFAMSMDTDDVSFGLNVLQENASIASEIYGFFDGVRYSPEDFDYLVNLDLIDSDGEVVTLDSFISISGFSSMSTMRGNNFPDIQAIRFTIAVQPVRRIIPLTLYDIPIVVD